MKKRTLPDKAKLRATQASRPQKDEGFETDDGNIVMIRVGRSPKMSQDQKARTKSFTLYGALLDEEGETVKIQEQAVVVGPHEVSIPREIGIRTTELLEKEKEYVVNLVLQLRDTLEGEDDLPEVEPL